MRFLWSGFRKLTRCGPGVISGAANDDPSCLITYLAAGASLRYSTLWTSLWLFPVVAIVQYLCA
ncbi:MAG TPA: hypothetical protein VE621_06170, partial [Bryobacteraceae bacterium]|nr:hypothetical protein [Bryobacteraceae bacterium]